MVLYIVEHESQRIFDNLIVIFFSLISVKSLSDLVNESLSLSEMDAVAASSRLSSASAAVAAASGGKSIDNTTTEDSADDAVPTLSSLALEASEAIGNELPAARVLRRLQPPTGKLIAITKNMNHHLTSLLVRIIFGIFGDF